MEHAMEQGHVFVVCPVAWGWYLVYVWPRGERAPVRTPDMILTRLRNQHAYPLLDLRSQPLARYSHLIGSNSNIPLRGAYTQPEDV
jgi:hypothetical protein